jgi:Cu(I)/Ag(I) efflux system protein CusF
MRKLVFIAQLVSVGLIAAAFACTPVTLAFAHEGEEHEMISGVIQKVDESAGKITLKHGPIKSLGMDEGMTMVFAIDTSLLKGLKAGDNVTFQPERVNGQLTVTKIQMGK